MSSQGWQNIEEMMRSSFRAYHFPDGGVVFHAGDSILQAINDLAASIGLEVQVRVPIELPPLCRECGAVVARVEYVTTCFGDRVSRSPRTMPCGHFAGFTGELPPGWAQ